MVVGVDAKNNQGILVVETFPIKDKDNQIFAFELENVYISPKTIAGILQRTDGVREVRRNPILFHSNDVYINFTYKNKNYIVWEPFGDSSRYWIGPDSHSGGHEDISIIEKNFQSHKPPFLRRLIGDILTFKLPSVRKE